MADSDDGSRSLRDGHYNQQRSSLRSDRSLRTASRPQSSRPWEFLLDPDDDVGDAAASPAPDIPRRKQSQDRDKRHSSRSSIRDKRHSSKSNNSAANRGRSHAGSRESRIGSKSQNMDAYWAPEEYGNRDEVAAPVPMENPHEQSWYQHNNLEAERSRLQAESPSWRTAWRESPVDRLGTSGTEHTVTALPTILDASAEHTQQGSDSPDARGEREHSHLATELYTVSYLIFFAIWGTLARLGLQWLTFYPGAPVIFSELWANVGGSLVMGFLAEDRRLFREEWGKATTSTRVQDEEKADPEAIAASKSSHTKVKKTIPLYIGLATGFCGCFTSFSSFMRDVFSALSNDMPSPLNHPYPAGTVLPNTTSTVHRNGGYSFMAILAVLFITISLCYSALRTGAHIAIFFERSRVTPTLPFRLYRRFIDPLVVFLSFGMWLGAVFMSIWPPDRPSGPSSRGPWANETWRGQAIFACVFAPVGCLLRFYMSLSLNSQIPSFPLGTFCVNIFGTAVLGMAFDLQHVGVGGAGVGGGRVACQILQGIMDGFCGSLTTVSTWILEIATLRNRHAYFYAFSSVAAGLSILVAVMGGVRWSVGWGVPACVT
jgi:CrcB protein